MQWWGYDEPWGMCGYFYGTDTGTYHAIRNMSGLSDSGLFDDADDYTRTIKAT